VAISLVKGRFSRKKAKKPGFYKGSQKKVASKKGPFLKKNTRFLKTDIVSPQSSAGEKCLTAL